MPCASNQCISASQIVASDNFTVPTPFIYPPAPLAVSALQIAPDIHSSAFCDCFDVADLAEYLKLYHHPTPLTSAALSMAYPDFVLFRSKMGRFLFCYCAPFVSEGQPIVADYALKMARHFQSHGCLLCAVHGTRLKGKPIISKYGSQGKSQAQPDGGEGHSVITTGYPVTVPSPFKSMCTSRCTAYNLQKKSSSRQIISFTPSAKSGIGFRVLVLVFCNRSRAGGVSWNG